MGFPPVLRKNAEWMERGVLRHSLKFSCAVIIFLRCNVVSPGRKSFPAGAVCAFGKRTCKPNSVVCGHSSRRRVAADAHQRPTRRFRHCMRQRLKAPPHAKSSLAAPGRHRVRVLLRTRASLPIWSCSVWGLPCPDPHGPGGALLPHHFTLTGGLAVQACALRADPLLQLTLRLAATPAVSFLWHWPSARLEARIPDVIRHTALRSSDFPPPVDLACARPPAATARSSCQLLV